MLEPLVAARVLVRAMWRAAELRSASSEPEWSVVHRAADLRRPAVADAIEAGWQEARDRLDKAALQRAVESGDATGAAALVEEALDAAAKDAAKALATVLRGVAVDAARRIVDRNRGDLRQAATVPKRMTLEGSFQLVNPRSSEWARKYAAEKIVEFGETTKMTKQTIARIISSGMAKQTDLREVSARIEDLIGLREDQVEWLEKWVEETEPTNEQYERMSDKLLGERADMIARTETIAAATAGQQLLWEAAGERGLLPDGTLQKWIVTPDDRLCVTCEGMEGQTAALGEEFDTGDENLGTVTGPPAHPNCRCALGLVFPGEEDAQLEAAAERAAFDPDQPRDDQGQWTDGGGGESGSAAPAGESRLEFYEADGKTGFYGYHREGVSITLQRVTEKQAQRVKESLDKIPASMLAESPLTGGIRVEKEIHDGPHAGTGWTTLGYYDYMAHSITMLDKQGGFGNVLTHEVSHGIFRGGGLTFRMDNEYKADVSRFPKNLERPLAYYRAKREEAVVEGMARLIHGKEDPRALRQYERAFPSITSSLRRAMGEKGWL